MFKGLKEKLKWLDPFTYVDLYVAPVLNPNKDERVELLIDVVFAFIFAFILYNYVLAAILGTPTPLVIVYSGSMEPALYRGDVVVLSGSKEFSVNEATLDFPVKGKLLSEYAEISYAQLAGGQFRATGIKINGEDFGFGNGPIAVYHSETQAKDIIHRAVLKLKAPDGEFVITEGDNVLTNNVPDQYCTSAEISGGRCISPEPVEVKKLRGQYLFHVPLIGYVKLLVFDDLLRLLFSSKAS